MKKIFLFIFLTVSVTVASQMATVKGLSSGKEGFLSIRDKPKGAEIGRVYNGDKIEILDSKGKWYKIYNPSSKRSGWCYGKWISLNNKASASVPASRGIKMLQVNIYDNETHATYSTAEIRSGGDYCVIGVALSNYDKPSVNLVHVSTENCVSFTNSKGVEVICTKSKKMCKTKSEVRSFVTKVSKDALMKELALQEQSSNNDVLVDNNDKYLSESLTKVYTVDQLYSMVNHQNTDLTNKKIERSLIGKPVSGVCMVKEVDEDSFGKGYHVECEAPSGQILKLLTDHVEQIEHLKRGNRTSFTGTIKAIKAKNDFMNIKSLHIDL